MGNVLSLLLGWFGAQKKLLLALAAFVVIALLGSSIHTWLTERQRQQQLQYEQGIALYKQQATAAVTYADSLRTVAANRATRTAQLERTVAWLKRQLPDTSALDSLRGVVDSVYTTMSDSVKHAYRIIPLQQDLIHRQDSVITVQGKVLTRQDTLLADKDSTIVNFAAANDSLRAVLSHPPEPPKPERFLGFIPLPSRKTSAVVGFVVGFVGAVSVFVR